MARNRGGERERSPMQVDQDQPGALCSHTSNPGTKLRTRAASQMPARQCQNCIGDLSLSPPLFLAICLVLICIWLCDPFLGSSRHQDQPGALCSHHIQSRNKAEDPSCKSNAGKAVPEHGSDPGLTGSLPCSGTALPAFDLQLGSSALFRDWM
jgi:hypothetical protein